MSVFECKVSELNENKDKISSFETSTVTSPNPSTNTNTNTISSTNQDVNQVTSSSKKTGNVSGFSKILNEKNLKAILLIACVYFLLHSEPVLEFVNSKIPSIISNLTLNSLGKLIFGLLIGFLFIVGSFFFQDP
jgi:hypothetical protein